MATKDGQVTLAGRFPEGTHVRLVEVKDESVLRSEGGKLVGTGKVKDGTVQFKSGVKTGGRYFIVGYVNGSPLEVRARGNRADDDTALAQPPVQPVRTRLGDGSWSDEAPEREDTPASEAAPHVAQRQVPEGTPQRSETPRGSGHPLTPGEPYPYPRQEDVPDGTPQASETATGQAVPIIAGAVRQEDVPDGVAQRSDTETGVATVIPSGDAVDAQREKESSLAKATRGEPGKAAAEPLVTDKAPAQRDLKELDVAEANVGTAKKGTAEKLEKAVAQDKS